MRRPDTPEITIETNQPADTGTLVGEIVAAAGNHQRYSERPEEFAENLVPIVLFLATADDIAQETFI